MTALLTWKFILIVFGVISGIVTLLLRIYKNGKDKEKLKTLAGNVDELVKENEILQNQRDVARVNNPNDIRAVMSRIKKDQ